MQTESQDGYGIGAVARRTGISAPNIRMWEKRYEAVVPGRTSTNRRVYSAEDIERLRIMKQLTSRGHAISSIANLNLEQLRERHEQETPPPSNSTTERSLRSRILTIGPGPAVLAAEEDFLNATAVARFESIEEARANSELPAADLVIIETETLFPETITAIRDIVTRTGSPPAILLYRFTTSRTVTALARAIDGMTLLQAPIADRHLRRECLVKLGADLPGDLPVLVDEAAPIPERLYTPQQLSQLTRLSTTVECECPQHLAGLLQSLSAFEKYSSECEDRNPQDALLHAFLHRTTANVRRSMEEALRHVVEAEGIAVE